MGCTSNCFYIEDSIINPGLNIIIIESESNLENLKITDQAYQKIKSLGKGSYGEVFLIKSLQTHKEFALKETTIKKNQEYFHFFSMNEINILSNLHNPFIISLKCAFKTQIDKETEKLDIIMEYVDNGDLNKLLIDYIYDEKYFEEKRLLNWLFQVCLALTYLQKNEVIHRDIKPSNIFLMADDTIKLGDFGISKKVSFSQDNQIFIGTPIYISPEIINKKDFSFKTDIWSLGVTFLQLISLRIPFLGFEKGNIYENILSRNFNPNILNKDKNGFNENLLKNFSKELLDLIDEMISINPDDRPNVKDILKRDIIKNRMESYLKENNFDKDEVNNSIEKINQEITEILLIINDKNITQKERKKNVKNIKDLEKRKEFLKKLIIIDNYSKDNFQTIEIK